MREDSGLPFASTCDMAHTCGHDMHAAMLLGAAKILKEMEDELPGTVKLMFQPGEEILAGAASMLQDGLLESPNVDAVLAQHVSSALPSGKIAYNVGGFASSADAIVITIKGKGCHGASPNEGIDPVAIASHVIIGLMEINAREVNPAETVVLTFGSVNSGSKNNILPDTAVITGTLRSYNSQVRNYVKERIAQISQGIAAAYRAEAVVEYPYGCPPLVADKSVMDTVGQGIKDCIGEDLVMDDMPRSNGSEDFGYVTELCKGGMIYLGTDPGDRGTPYPHHTEKVYFDEAAMANGVAAYVAAALAWLDKNQ